MNAIPANCADSPPACGHEDVADTDIAIVGMDCRFPGARDVDELWRVLREGRETVSHFSVEEMREAGVPAEKLADPNYVRAKGVLEDVEYFDHEFFGFTRLEAEVMDPQQRLFLQFAWQVLERAGYDSERFDGRIGLFAGQAFNTYLLNNLRHARESHIKQFHGIELLIMSDKDFLSMLAAHHLALRGPVMTVQSACSTALVAVHEACQALLAAECEMALAGAITVYSPQVKGYLYEPGNLISPDGHVCSFDAAGRGTVYSSGMGMVVLKRLADAVRDGDTVHAVIKGTAICSDGGRKSLFKAPSPDGIAEVAATALAVSGVEPACIRMMEGNGSGTPNGDAIEVEALTRAFRSSTSNTGYCAIGSVKSNLGHLNVAAGVAALLKAALAVERGEIPPTVNFTSPNPAIAFEDSPFYVAQRLETWDGEARPRVAAVNSYGVGGTNAHLVVAQPPVLPASDRGRGEDILVVSARTPAALERMRIRLAEHLVETDALTPLADVCYTLQIGRRAFEHRIAVAGATAEQLAARLRGAPAREAAAQPSRAPAWWFAPELLDDAVPILASAADPAWPALREEIASALPRGRSLQAGLSEPRDDVERALRTFCAQMMVLRALVPATGAAAVAGAGVGAVTAAVAAGRLGIVDAMPLLLSGADGASLDSVAAGTDVRPETPELLVLGGAVRRSHQRALGPAAAGHGWANAVAELWLCGFPIDWAALHGGFVRRRVALPTYSFERVRCWVDIPSDTRPHAFDAAR